MLLGHAMDDPGHGADGHAVKGSGASMRDGAHGGAAGGSDANNRNLATFEVDLATTELLAPVVPDHCTVISESGIRTVSDVQRVANAGIDGVLVGEALMRAPEPQKLLRELQDAARHVTQRSSGVRGVAGVQERSH